MTTALAKPKPMRETMPLTAAWIDQLREAFGTESINNSIHLKMQGFPDWFHATEGAHEVGTAFKPVQKSISLADCALRGPVPEKQTTTKGKK